MADPGAGFCLCLLALIPSSSSFLRQSLLPRQQEPAGGSVDPGLRLPVLTAPQGKQGILLTVSVPQVLEKPLISHLGSHAHS